VSPEAAFGDQLRRSRNEKGWTQDELGERLGCTGGHISGLETAVKSPSRKLAIKVDEVLGTGMTFQILWQAIKNQAFLEGFPEYAGEEARAKALRLFHHRRIPGLIQTVEYAEAIEAANVRRGTITPDQAEARVRLLLNRQRLLDKSPRPTFHAILDEACLRRPVGGPEVMARQLGYLEELFERPKTTIQVAPASLAETNPLNHPLTLLTLPGRVMLCYTEGLLRSSLERDTDIVSGWAENYDLLQVEALPRAASLAMIRKLREEFEDA
jgi:transcriptional regulator with XRE-family HTH domain